MSPLPHLAPALLLLLLTPLALAQEPPIDAIVASRVEPGESTGNTWNVTMADLERDHPVVARAVRQPNVIQRVNGAEAASTRAFFDRMDAQGSSAVRIAGELYTVGITLAQAPLPPVGDAGAQARNEAPGLAAGLLGAALATAALLRKT